MKDYQIHDIANIFPMMTAPELESLKQDIVLNGLREPIYIYKGKIIDGRNRYKACKELGITPDIREYTGNENELIDFVISLNLHRRHLNTSQKACLAIELIPSLENRTRENLSKKLSAIRKGDKNSSALKEKNSSQLASEIFGVSERYIFDAKKLLKQDENRFNQVRAGNLTLTKALKEIQLSALMQSAETDIKDNQSSNIVSGNNEVTAFMQSAHTQLTKHDLKRISELVTELGITEQKATDYILKRKKDKKPVQVKRKAFDEIRFRIEHDVKAKLIDNAKQAGKTLSEYLRDTIHI